jgi:anti-sigma B factor antagonist
MNIEFRNIQGVLVVRILDRRIDAHEAPQLKAEVGARIDAGARLVVLDLSAVDLIDSAGLGALLSLFKKALLPGGGFVLCGCGSTVQALMKITRMERVFTFLPGEAEAVAFLAGRRTPRRKPMVASATPAPESHGDAEG